MRIAIINTIRAYGGGEKWVLRAAVRLAERGHTPYVIGVADGELAARCAEAGLPFTPAVLNGGSLLRGAAALQRAFLSELPEVLIACNERAARLAAIARTHPGSRLTAIPLVYRNGLEGSFKNKPLNRYVVAPRVDRFVVNAASTREELLSFGWISPDRLQVIYNGVDPAPIEAADPSGLRAELGVGPDDLVVLAAARLVPEKGHAQLLEALAVLTPGERPWIWIAGEGPELEPLSEQVARLGVADRVRFLGFRRDVARLLRAADLLSHPSRREGAPNIVLEAMVAGLPVVGVAASGTVELVRDGETGLLSAPGDVPALAENLGRLCRDAGLRRRLGDAARARALTDFTEQGSTDRWIELLESVANGRPRS